MGAACAKAAGNALLPERLGNPLSNAIDLIAAGWFAAFLEKHDVICPHGLSVLSSTTAAASISGRLPSAGPPAGARCPHRPGMCWAEACCSRTQERDSDDL